jgi:hypothetical protein
MQHASVSRRLKPAQLLICLLLAACSDDPDTKPDDRSTDGGLPDAGTDDSDSGPEAVDSGHSGGANDAGGLQQDAEVSRDAGEDAGGGGSGGCAGAAFCETFESDTFDPRWTLTKWWQEPLVVEIQSDKAYAGTRAAHFKFPGSNDNATEVTIAAAVPDALKTHLFGRAYVYTDLADARGHMFFIAIYDPERDPFHQLEIGHGGEGSWQTTAWGHDGEFPVGSGNKVPKGRWACIEWEMNKATGANIVYVDGQRVAGSDGSADTADWTDFKEMKFGMHQYGPSADTDADIYFDDIALDDARIGCE